MFGTNGYHVKAKDEKITAASRSLCHQNRGYKISPRRLADYVKKLHQIKKRAARVARLFFLIQPIESLICSVDVAVAVVIS